MRRDKFLLVLLLLLFLAGCASVQSPSATSPSRTVIADVGWSQPVNGIKARLSFEKGDLFVGTRITRVFLELRNVTDNANPLYFSFSPVFMTTRLFDAAGKPVPVSGTSCSIMMLPPYNVCLPHNSSVKLDVTLVGWGVPPNQRAIVGSCGGPWVIGKNDPADYWLGGTFKSEMPEKDKLPDSLFDVWQGTIEIPKARVDVLDDD